MADQIKKTVITEFIAETQQYLKSLDKMVTGLDDATEATENLDKTTKETTKSMNTSIGGVVDGLGKLVPGFDKIAGGFKKAEQASKAFGVGTKSALIATGIGAFVVAIGSIASAFNDVKDKADTELSYMQLKLKQVGTAITEGLTKAFDKFKEVAVNTLSTVATWLDIIIPGTKAYVEAIQAEAKAHEANKKAIDDENEARKVTIKEYERELAMAQARGDSQKELLELQLMYNAEKKKSADADQYALETEARILQVKLDQLETARQQAIIDAEEERRIARMQPLIQGVSQANTEALGVEKKAMMDANKELVKNLDLTKAKLNLTSQQGDMAVIAGEKQIEAEQAVADILGKSALYQKAVALDEMLVQAGQAISAIWASPKPGVAGKIALSALVAGITAKNIAQTAGVNIQMPTFGDGGTVPGKRGGMIQGRSHASGGVKFAIGGYTAEAEGGEFIVNKRATANFLPMLKAINATGVKKYADGGEVTSTQAQELRRTQDLMNASASAQPVLVLEDFKRAERRLQTIETLSRF